MIDICLVPVRGLLGSSRSVHFGDVSDTNGHVTQNSSATRTYEAQGQGILAALGTGPYLSPGGGGGGAEDLRGDHLIFRRTKGGISRN